MDRRSLMGSLAVGAVPITSGCAALGERNPPEVNSTVEIQTANCDRDDKEAEITGGRTAFELVGHAEVPPGCYVVSDDAHYPSDSGYSVLELNFRRVDSDTHCLDCQGQVTYRASISVEETEITELRVLHNTPDEDVVYGTFAIEE